MNGITFTTRRTDAAHVVQVLEQHGAEHIEAYNLIENWGYTFEIAGNKYDARFWVTCYGVPFNEWEVWPVKEIGDHILAKDIENELNA